MTLDQILLFALFGAILSMLLWGRLRYDLVAASGLLVAVMLGLVPQEKAFSGFADPAVVIVALVLIVSRAFENSGALTLVTRRLVSDHRPTSRHIAMTGGIGAALSAIINNVAALALLMPIDVEAARKAGRPPGVTLMPLAFATILGGMVTLIGTPPNIIASGIRERLLGSPYGMFDFAPVGGAVAIAGLAFVALVGWRLVPRRADQAAATKPSSFEAEVSVPEGSAAIDRHAADIDEEARTADVIVLGLVREGRKLPRTRMPAIAAGDKLRLKGSSDAIAAFIKALDMQQPGEQDGSAEGKADQPAGRTGQRSGRKEDRKSEGEEEEQRDKGPEVVEAVVRADSLLVGRSAGAMRLRPRFGVTLLGIARAGTLTRRGVHDNYIAAGDVLLLTGRGTDSATLDLLGVIPLSRASVAGTSPGRVAITIGLFAAAIAAASLGVVSFTIAIAMAVAAYAALGIVPAREFYLQIEWPIVVMLAFLLPIGAAFEEVGGTALIAEGIVTLTSDYSPVVALVAIMVATMTLSDVLNNVATMVITGPVAIGLARELDVNPDTFLMGVAIAASCAFLTPIGHKNNTLIMGPGGFRFSDYWRMGLPLEVVVLAVSVPMLLIVWPL
ncbi:MULTISPECIES: SLC13 family permease [Chelatococcus]|uniref:Di/tricarboxylate transporter n=1 Tax=Chelatococcus caeni TaxID=1348468 RepID=A0A840C4C5_9HYPH|nr:MULTISPECIES: SLC13 family permease [Chelatococcus]ALA16678.1 potassium transporter TrkA [Chelatococcus sp. CO-6]MBB4019693.1 di/tricarboxylate transporter [Chelatococcus caeni]